MDPLMVLKMAIFKNYGLEAHWDLLMVKCLYITNASIWDLLMVELLEPYLGM